MDAQLPDKIYLQDQWFELYSNPLEDYWAKNGKKRPSFCSVTRCKRGYIASWEVKDHYLFLRDIQGYYEKSSFFLRRKKVPYSMKLLFPKAGQRLVKATWFSGKIRVPRGKMIIYENQDYDSRFEKEQILTIESGLVRKIVTLDYAHQTLVVNSEIHVQ